MPAVTKDFRIDRGIDDVWAFLVTPADVAPAVPGCESYEELEEDVFEARVTVTVAYTTLNFDAHIEIVDKDPPGRMRVEGTAEPTGRMPGSATLTGELALDAVDNNVTEGTIDVEFAIRGRLGSLGDSAFRSKCDTLTQEFIDNVTTRLEGGSVDG